MRKTLSDHAVRALKPRSKRYAVADPEMRGLWIRVQPTGVKSYAAVARNPDGKQIWTTIGAADAMPIAKARQEAPGILARIRAGLPAIEPKAETFADVTDRWRKRHLETNGVISTKGILRWLNAHVLPVWKDRPLVSIRRSDITSLLDHVEDKHGAPTADRVLSVIRSIMNWHASRVDDYNPPIARGMTRAKSSPRARILNDDEIRLVWAATESAGVFGAFLRMALLTAQRKTKVVNMRWDAIEDGAWTVPKAPREKGTGGVLALPEMALTILAAQPRLVDNPYVFAGRGRKRWNGFRSAGDALNAKLPPEMPGWVIHDLRRSARSLMSRAGVASEIAEKSWVTSSPALKGSMIGTATATKKPPHWPSWRG